MDIMDRTVASPTDQAAAGSAVDATLMAADASRSTAAHGITSSGTAAAQRTTVLPSLRLQNGQPKLLAEDRLRYETVGQLGQGGMGEVLKVTDNDIRRTVALKRLLPGLDDPALLARFVEEIRIVGQLEHPGIVPVHDVGIDEHGQHYFVMKYV